MENLGIKSSLSRWFMLGVIAFMLLVTPIQGSGDAALYYDDTSVSVNYTGNWVHSSGWPRAYNNTVSWTNTSNDSVSLSFYGSSITRVYTMAQNRGVAEIFIDGVSQTPLGDIAATPRWQAAKTWSFPIGAHTIQVKKSTSTGYVDADGFIVDVPTVGQGTYDNSHSQLKYIGNWTHSTGWPSAYNGTVSWSNNTDDAITFTFIGDIVTYYYTRANNRGKVGIAIDGIQYADIDLYSSATVWQDSITYSVGAGIHTLHISVTGQKNPSSVGTYVDVDAIRIGYDVTPTQCDSNAKYDCSKVQYVPNPNKREILGRMYAGGIDGGADQWQLYWAKDWESVGGTWYMREKFPEGPWFTNIPLSSYYSHGPWRTRIVNAAVQMKFRYYECISGQPCYYWCSPNHEHYLSNGTSDRVGSSTCFE